MAITLVKELYLERTGRDSPTNRISKRVFLVETDSIADGPKTIYRHEDIPQPFDADPDDDTLFLINRDPKPYGDRLHWKVYCEYRARNDDQSPAGTAITKPTDLPAKISYGFNQYEVPLTLSYGGFLPDDLASGPDLQGDPTKIVQNSAGDVFSPEQVQVESATVIKIQRNEKDDDFDPEDTINAYKDTINLYAVVVGGVTIKAMTGRMRSISGDLAWDNEGDAYFQVSYEIEINSKTWVMSILDQGYYTKPVSPSVEPVKITDSGGVDLVTEPMKLNGVGERWDGVTAHHLDYLGYFPRDWGLLRLPTTKKGK